MQHHTRAFIDQALCINFMPESMQQSRSVCGFEVNVMISICQQHPQLPHSAFPSPHIPQNSCADKKHKMWVTFRFHPDASWVLWGKERATGRDGACANMPGRRIKGISKYMLIETQSKHFDNQISFSLYWIRNENFCYLSAFRFTRVYSENNWGK